MGTLFFDSDPPSPPPTLEGPGGRVTATQSGSLVPDDGVVLSTASDVGALHRIGCGRSPPHRMWALSTASDVGSVIQGHSDCQVANICGVLQPTIPPPPLPANNKILKKNRSEQECLLNMPFGT